MFCFVYIDDGPHYHNSGFLLYLAEVNAAFNLHLIEYNNFEAGEGKSKLDTHFAHISHTLVWKPAWGINWGCKLLLVFLNVAIL